VRFPCCIYVATFFFQPEDAIRHSPSKAAILEHVLGAQRLNNNHLVLMNELSAQLLKKVCSGIRYPPLRLQLRSAPRAVGVMYSSDILLILHVLLHDFERCTAHGSGPSTNSSTDLAGAFGG